MALEDLPEIPEPSPDNSGELTDQLAHPNDDAPDTDPGDDDIPFDKDIPCIRCDYNLRGLKPDGQCPECGASIRKSLNFAMERILCLACMRPVHPSVTKCPNCGAPMNSAASGANYWQVTPRGVARRKETSEPKPQKPFPWQVVTWIICSPLAGFLLLGGLTARTESFAIKLYICIVGVLLLVPVIIISRIHKRRLAAYQRHLEEYEKTTLDRISAGGTAGRKPRTYPIPPPSPIIAWFICTPLALVFVVLSILTLPDVLLAIVLVAVAVLLLMPALRASHQYRCQLWTYKKQMAAIKAELAASETAAEVKQNS